MDAMRQIPKKLYIVIIVAIISPSYFSVIIYTPISLVPEADFIEINARSVIKN
jgi:ABC-type antimicrobial peptide transport system permease subunit